MRNLLKISLALLALLTAATTALAQDNPAVGRWTNTQMAGPNNPYISSDMLLTADGGFREQVIINPGGVADYAGSWSYDPQSSMLTYLITQWLPVAIPPPAANQNVTVRVDFANGGYTMIMDQPGGVPIQWTRQQ
jgi:hypothetical protein